MNINKTLELQKRALQYMPGPHSNLGVAWQGYESRFMSKGKGSHLWDIDGNEYIDYIITMGAGILGYGNSEWIKAINNQIELPYLTGWCQVPIEVELAQKIVELIPCAEKVRFGVSGSEAIQLVIRLARAYTKRRYFIRFEGHYHGWMDNVMGGIINDNTRQKPFALDIREDPYYTEGKDTAAFEQSFKLPWNDIEILENVLKKYGEEIALILMEPILVNNGCCMPRPGYLERIRELCNQYGIVLCFDEILTGFRVSLNGAQGLLGVTPDISTFGKGLGGGIPVTAIAGKRDILDQLLQQKVTGAGTFNGYPLGTAAALATIKILEKDNAALYKHIDKVQKRLMAGLKEISRKAGFSMLLQGIRGVFFFEFLDKDIAYSVRDLKGRDVAKQKILRRTMLEQGILYFMRGRWFVSAAITEADVDRTLECAEYSFRRLKGDI